MTDYLQRLARRLHRPTAKDPLPTSIAPFIRSVAVDAEPEKVFESATDMSVTGTTAPIPPPVAQRIDQPPPFADRRSTAPDAAPPPAQSAEPAPSPVTPQTVKPGPSSTPPPPDGLSTVPHVSIPAQTSAVEPTRIRATHGATRDDRTEVEVSRIDRPVAIEPLADTPLSSRPDKSNREKKGRRHEKPLKRALKRNKQSGASTSPDPITESNASNPAAAPPESLNRQQTPFNQNGVPSPALTQEPNPMPTLHPSVPPASFHRPRPKKSDIQIGRLHVEVAPPPKTSPPPSSAPKPAQRRPSRRPGPQAVYSKLRFGLGQL